MNAEPIPVAVAEGIAKAYGYHQVVIIARRVGEAGDGGEHCTTYGTDEANKSVAARIGTFLTEKVMNWRRENVTVHEDYVHQADDGVPHAHR